MVTTLRWERLNSKRDKAHVRMNNFMNKVLEATKNGERRRAMEFDETTSLRFKENSAYDLLM